MSYYAQPHHAAMRQPEAERIACRVKDGRADGISPDNLQQAYRVLSEGHALTLEGHIRLEQRAAAIYRHLVEHGEVANV